MKTFTAQTADPDAIVQELLHGKGAVRLTGLFSLDQIAEARGIIMDHSSQADKATHFQGKAAASPDIRQLLGLNSPYPEVLDTAKAGNSEGRT